MRQLVCLCWAVLFCLAPSLLLAQEAQREFCRDADQGNLCPGEDCPCVDDTLEIVFQDDLTSSIYEYDTFDPANKETIRSRVVIDTVSDQIRGYSFGVRHDTADINPLPGPPGLNIDGGPMMEDPVTASDPARMGGFVALRLIVANQMRQGYICAIVLSFQMPVVLAAPERNVIVNVNYQLERDVGAAGTMLRFAEDLGEPPTQTVLTVDQLEFPPMVDKDEMNCTDGMDNDFDGLIDRDDPDCVIRTGVSRIPRILIDGIVRGMGGDPEICDNGTDDDGDGLVDCMDTEDCCGEAVCAEDPNCVAPEEVCDNGTDDDGDGLVDCDDVEDCPADMPPCNVVPEEVCDNGTDDDGDGLVDCMDTEDCCADAACADDPACGPVECPNWAFYFGPDATTENVQVGANYVISMRNVEASTGFQLGVRDTGDGLEFTGELGGNPDTLVELLIADNARPLPIGHAPDETNTATGEPGNAVTRGAAIAGFPAGSDILLLDLIGGGNGGVGGDGYTVGYVSDTNNDGTDNLIAATGAEGCPVNEILLITGDGGDANFNRADADGNMKINVVDSVTIIQLVVMNITAPFDCDDAFDANDDGTIDLADGVVPINYVFRAGEAPPDPFRTCSGDPTDTDPLTCNQSNCQ